MTGEQAFQIKEKHSAELLKVPGVHGVGVGQDEHQEPVLVVIWDRNRYPDLPRRLPHQIEGCPVKFVEGGPFQKLPAAKPSSEP